MVLFVVQGIGIGLSVALAWPGGVHDGLWSNTGAALATSGRREW